MCGCYTLDPSTKVVTIVLLPFHLCSSRCLLWFERAEDTSKVGLHSSNSSHLILFIQSQQFHGKHTKAYHQMSR